MENINPIKAEGSVIKPAVKNESNSVKDVLAKKILLLRSDKKYIKNKEKLALETEKLKKLQAKIKDLSRDVKYHEVLIETLENTINRIGV